MAGGGVYLKLNDATLTVLMLPALDRLSNPYLVLSLRRCNPANLIPKDLQLKLVTMTAKSVWPMPRRHCGLVYAGGG